MNLRSAFILSTGLLAGCTSVAPAPAPRIQQVPVCNTNCQRALALSDVARTLAQVKSPKTGGIDPTMAALALRMHMRASPEIKEAIETGLKEQETQIVGAGTKSPCLTQRQPDGTVDVICPRL